MLFCNENGEMKDSRCVDLNELGQTLAAKGIPVSPDIQENMACFLECFGGITFEEVKIMVMPKEEKDPKLANKGKEAPIKKPGMDPNEQIKPVEKIQKMTSYKEFMNSLQTYKVYDQMMRRL